MTIRRLVSGAFGAALLACALLVFAVSSASAAGVRYVSTSGSNTNGCTQSQPCATISHAVSTLSTSGGGTINVGPGTFSDNVSLGGGTWTIQGAGMHRTIVSGGFKASVFDVEVGSTATIEDLTITAGDDIHGGGVYSVGALTIARDEITLNAAVSGDVADGQGIGGGIDEAPGNGASLQVSDSEIDHNQASAQGAGIASAVGGEVIQRSLIDDNTVNDSPQIDFAHLLGGGVRLTGDTGGALTDDTIVGNAIEQAGTPTGRGAALAATNAELSGNTIANNTSQTGGGLYTVFGTIDGNIFSGNTAPNCEIFYPQASTGPEDNVDDQTGDGCGLLGGQDGNVTGQSAKLGPLQANGGPTDTMALQSGSPAIDRSRTSTCTLAGDVDQRDFPRRSTSRGHCDSGAWDGGGVSVPAKALIVSELRPVGPSDLADQYVDLYNNSSAPLDLTGWSLGYKINSNSAAVDLPAQTLPAGGHVLIAQPGYSLGAYAPPDVTDPRLDAGDGVQVQAQDGTVTDTVGLTNSALHAGTGLPNPTVSGSAQWAFVRRFAAGAPVDTNDNAADFVFVAADADTNSHGVDPVLGAPGPMDLNSPIQINPVAQSTPFDTTAAVSAAPNRQYDASTATLIERRTITDTSSTQVITRLRLRITDLTTYGTAGTGDAILTVQNAADETVDGRTVHGLRLDAPPAQPDGGGLNSSLTVPVPTGGLAPGQSIDVVIVLHVVRGGAFRLNYNLEDDLEPYTPPAATGSTTATDTAPATPAGTTTPAAAAPPAPITGTVTATPTATHVTTHPPAKKKKTVTHKAKKKAPKKVHKAKKKVKHKAKKAKHRATHRTRRR